MIEDLHYLAGEITWVIRRHHRVLVNGVAIITAAIAIVTPEALTIVAIGYMVQTAIAEA